MAVSGIPSPSWGKGAGSYEDPYWESLYKYEKYVSGFENETYGYHPGQGYPMYLFNFGFMYYELYRHTGEGVHLFKFLRCAAYAEAIRNPDWTWNFWNSSWRSILFNWQGVELFIDAYYVTADQKYLSWAEDTAYGILNTSDYGLRVGAYNGHFLGASAIAYYAHVTGDMNPILLNAGRDELAFSLTGYDPATGKWYYSTSTKSAGVFDGRAAYYGFGVIGVFLYWEEAFKSVYPEEYAYLLIESPKIIHHGRAYLLPSCTWWYTSEVPDYTEGAADAVVGFYLAQRRYGEDYSDIVSCAMNTILSRQAPNGGYYKTSNTTEVDIWYTDNIGVSITWYLNRISTPLEKARGFTYIFTGAHLSPSAPPLMEKIIEHKVILLANSCGLPPEKKGYTTLHGSKVSWMISRWVKPEFRMFFINLASEVCPQISII